MGKYFPEGTVLSVPSYSIHRDRRIWGEDTEAYRPERWFERDAADLQKTFNPFSIGPRYVIPISISLLLDQVFATHLGQFRACVGRNLAYLELQVIIASLMRRYDIVWKEKNQKVGYFHFFVESRNLTSCS